MYSLTIHFGPNAICWQFLFKDKEKAEVAHAEVSKAIDAGRFASVVDDFGQVAFVGQVSGYLLEDLDLVEAARIQRSLAEERCKVRLMEAAKLDPVIKEAIRKHQQGPSVLTPMGGIRG